MNELKEILEENGVVLTSNETNELLKIIKSNGVEDNLLENASAGVQNKKIMTAFKILAGIGVSAVLGAGAVKLWNKYKKDTASSSWLDEEDMSEIAPNSAKSSKRKGRGVSFDNDVEVQEFNINTGEWGDGYIETISDTDKPIGIMRRKS